ncbi:MAG TPA: ATP-binding protein [Planctomycetota bacterium]|jgi:anti-sigma regulatory factor (Ser/Thr protein kinase)|nr:ATP-binding protein [Planctomycetota bacterium]
MTKLIQKTISKPCHPKFLNEVRGLLGETLAEVPMSRRDKDLIILAVDEAVSSIVQYARYKGFQSQVTLTVDIDDVRFKATLVDSLNVFELRGGLSDTQMAESLAREKSYTMGVFLIRQIMDEISYVYRKGFQNELELIKFL